MLTLALADTYLNKDFFLEYEGWKTGNNLCGIKGNKNIKQKLRKTEQNKHNNIK